jgi:phosphatidylglycerol:prolipoprotein diacylglycerol transferase
MYPEIDIGSLTFTSYSVLYTLAFSISVYLFWMELKRKGEKFKIFVLISLTVLLGGFGGAKIFYILLNFSLGDFFKDPVNTALSSGRIYHGGFIFSVLLVFLIVKLTKRNFWIVADSAAPALAIGISIGRIGCFLNGCCLGKPTDLPWGVNFYRMDSSIKLHLHPAQLYESIAMFLIFLFLWRTRKKSHAQGYIFSIYLLAWGVERFIIEFFRLTTPSPFFSLSVAQVISLVLVLFAIYNLVRLTKVEKRGKKKRQAAFSL